MMRFKELVRDEARTLGFYEIHEDSGEVRGAIALIRTESVVLWSAEPFEANCEVQGAFERQATISPQTAREAWGMAQAQMDIRGG